MSIYHCSIKIISRAGGRSAVASAAYRSGEKLYNDETGLIHDFTNKGGVIMNEIILPTNAPERYQNRELLWNEVQKIEKRTDAQFAREVEVALPVEMDRTEHIECIRNYIMKNFVDKGMIADWALHDKGDKNPHAHIMLTMRGIDEHEEWLQKQKTVFANTKDEKGRPIYNSNLPIYNSKDKDNTSQYRIPALDKNGNQKTRIRNGKGTEYLWEKISIPANNWNEHSQAELWRASWAEHCNNYLELEHQIDHRSYKRQGIDKEPSIHEGVIARQIEAEGKVADRCKINREIKKRNSFSEQMKAITKELTQIVIEKARSIYERFKEFRGSNGYSKCSGTDDECTRKSADRIRRGNEGELEFERTTGRILEIKRTANNTDEETENTNREIESTNNNIAIIKQRIAELQELAKYKENNRNERFRKLKERRSHSINDGRDAGSDREIEREQLRRTKEDIGAFIRDLEIKERNSKEKRDGNITERENRELERERSRIEAERAIRDGKPGITTEHAENKRRSQTKDYSR